MGEMPIPAADYEAQNRRTYTSDASLPSISARGRGARGAATAGRTTCTGSSTGGAGLTFGRP